MKKFDDLTELENIAKKLKSAKQVLIVGHMRPDGDCYGSCLALGCAVENIGVSCEIVNESDCPSNLRFLEGIERVGKTPTKEFDLVIALDSADDQRLGGLTDLFRRAKAKKIPTVNVDHHISNTRYGEVNFVRECAANCMNVAKLVAYLGAPFDKKTATYLLCGLLTDSGNFSHDDVGEECFLLAAKLVKAGADIRSLTYELFKKQPRARAALHSEVMGKMRFFFEEKFALIFITKQMMEKVGADNGMTEGFVDFPLNVETVEVAASIMEVKTGQYKISLRSKTYADVNKIAGVYGGGGHIRAAGCMLFGELEEVIDKLSYTVSQYL